MPIASVPRSEDLTLEDRAVGAYLGLAVGDALGATVEFMTPREIAAKFGVHKSIVGQGWLHLRDHHLLDASDAAGGSTTQAFAPVDIERAELEGFARAVAGEEAYPVTPAQAVHVVAVAEAVIASAETGGSEVWLP